MKWCQPRWRIPAVVLAALCLGGWAAAGSPLRIYGVEKVPLLFPPGVASWLNLEDVPRGGPLGTYFDVLLNACGFNDGFTFVNWSTSGRMAEFTVVTGGVDMAFPVARLWQLSPTTFGLSSGGVYYIPILSSPGTTILVQDTFAPTTIAQALVTLDTGAVLVTVLCAALVAGVMIWFLDQFDNHTHFPAAFFEGIFCGLYWAVTTMTSTGYGDFAPKSKLGRIFSVFFILAGVLLVALLQSFVIGNLAATRVATSLQTTADILNGQNVGAVNTSIEEWRMRSRGANVTLYSSIEQAMFALIKGDVTGLSAVAVDTLAAGLITNTLGDSVVRMSGKIDDPVTYGIVMRRAIAEQPSIVGTLNLAQCLDTLIRTGPMKFSQLTYFRPYAASLEFAENADIENKQEQEDVAYTAMVQAAAILPLSTLGFLLFVFYFNRSWDKRRTAEHPQGASVDFKQLPSASRLPPMIRRTTSDGDDEDDCEPPTARVKGSDRV